MNNALRATGLDPNWWYCALAVPDPDDVRGVARLRRVLPVLSRIVAGDHGAALVLVGARETNIVKIYDVVETNNHLNIVMEHLDGISLGSYL